VDYYIVPSRKAYLRKEIGVVVFGIQNRMMIVGLFCLYQRNQGDYKDKRGACIRDKELTTIFCMSAPKQGK